MADQDKISVLAANVSTLIDLHNAQKLSNIRLNAALKAEQAANVKLKSKVVELEDKLNSMAIANSLIEVNLTPKIARARVSNLIKQIDKCIALLNR